MSTCRIINSACRVIFRGVCCLQIFILISGIRQNFKHFETLSNCGPDLSPAFLLIFSVVLPPVVNEQPYIKENRPPVFYKVACVVSVAMTRENTYDI